MKISVIIPTYNSEKTIGKCVEGLLNQSVLPFEIIVADGNSTDQTTKICMSFKNSVVRLVLNPKGHATGSNRNYGASVANSEYLVFLDSDVVPHKDLIANYVRAFEKNDCVAGNVLILNPGKISNQIYFGEKVLLENHLKDGFIDSSFFWVMNFGIRKNKFIQFPNSTYSEDMVFISNIFKTGLKVKFCKEAIVFHPYSETLFDFFKKKVNCAKGFIDQSSLIDNIHPGSYFDVILKLMKIDVAKLKQLIQNKKVCFNPVSGFSLDGISDDKYKLENILCLSAAVAVFEKKGGKLDLSYEKLLT